MGLAKSRGRARREREARKYEQVLEQLDAGSLNIRGTDPDTVRRRMEDKARRAREGEQLKPRRRPRRILLEPEDDGLC